MHIIDIPDCKLKGPDNNPGISVGLTGSYPGLIVCGDCKHEAPIYATRNNKYAKNLASFNKKTTTRANIIASNHAAVECNADATVQPVPPKPVEPNAPALPQMEVAEIGNFMTLALALKILLAPSLTRQDVEDGSILLTKYLLEFKRVSLCGIDLSYPKVSDIKPFLITTTALPR